MAKYTAWTAVLNPLLDNAEAMDEVRGQLLTRAARDGFEFIREPELLIRTIPLNEVCPAIGDGYTSVALYGEAHQVVSS